MAAIYRAHPMFAGQDSTSGIRRSATTTDSTAQDFGLAALEGGDVEIIGNGAVLIGLSRADDRAG